MKLELIVPAIHRWNQKRTKPLCPPLAPAAVAALTPPEVDVSITDENVTAIDFHKETDLVGITVITATAKRAYEIADTFRGKGVKVILGGIHPTFLPAEAGQHADAVVIGEAEGIWPTVIKDFQANRLQKVYHQHERPSLVGLPTPRRDLFPKGAYFFPNTISTTRGCPYACSFCSVTSFFGRTYRCRPLTEIIEEIETLNQRKRIIFVDDNIVGRPKFARELFCAIAPYKLKWLGQASVTIARDDRLLKLAAASGCVGLLIGFESIYPANLAAVGKSINVADNYEEVIRKIHSYGIAIHGCFIFGLDQDDEHVFQSTIRFAQAMRLETAQFSFAMPHPGTALYESLEKDGRIVSKDWSKYNDQIVFKPKLLSREALQNGHDWASPEFYSIPSIFRRIGVFHRNWATFWASNLLLRAHWREIIRAKNDSKRIKV